MTGEINVKKLVAIATMIVATAATAHAEQMPFALQGQWCMTSGTPEIGNYTRAKNFCRADRLMVFEVRQQGFWIKIANTDAKIMCVPRSVDAFNKGWDVAADCGADDLSTPVKRLDFSFVGNGEDLQINGPWRETAQADEDKRDDTPKAGADGAIHNCKDSTVEETLMRAARWGGSVTIVKVINTTEIRSKNVSEARWCRSEALLSNGLLSEWIYELTWTSKTERRFWLQVKGAQRK
jgi:hypothetical protein